MQRLPGPLRRPALVKAWWLLLLVPPIAFGAIRYAGSLGERDHRERVEQMLFQRLDGKLEFSRYMQDVILANPQLLRLRGAKLGELNRDAATTVAQLTAVSGDGDSDQFQKTGLARIYVAQARLVDRVSSLLANGRTGEARALDHGTVGPAYQRLNALLDRSSAAQDTAAHDAHAAVARGNLLGYGGAGVVTLLIFWRLAAARRRLEREAADSELSDAHERHRQIVETASEGVWTFDAQNRTTFVNRAMAEMLGCQAQEMLGTSVSDFMAPEAAAEAQRSLRRRQAGATEQLELALRGRDGREVWTLFSSDSLYDAQSDFAGTLAMVADITDRKRSEDLLRHLADHDPLTDIYNRRRLLSELDRQLRFAARYDRSGAVLAFDLDNLKFANDSYGHATGDAMLKAVAEVLRARMRDTDVVARLGGDEFAVVLCEATEQEALVVASDVRSRLCERALGPPIFVSVGIAMFSGAEEITPDDILACADTALYEAKEHGGDQARVYTGRPSGALSWVRRIRTAMTEERLILYGQPIVDLATGRVAYHELLIRMVSDDGDIIPPAAFLPIAERFGLIREIDRWVTTKGLLLAMDGTRVAINLSGHSIGEQSIIAAVRTAIADGLNPADVIFEVTETAAMGNLATARPFAGVLRGIGCNVALDDFGTGFAVFTYLKHIPAAYLKIDMEFIRDIMTNKTDQQIVRSIVDIAHSLDKLTIAEGVEDAGTLELLREYGVDYAQGYHLGRPERLSPPTELEQALLRASELA